eukprot:6466543-Amphidinium_carterae.2
MFKVQVRRSEALAARHHHNVVEVEEATWASKGQEENYLTWKLETDRAGSLAADRAGSLATDSADSLVTDCAGSLVTDRAACGAGSLVADRAGSLVTDRAGSLGTDRAGSLVADLADRTGCLATDREESCLLCCDHNLSPNIHGIITVYRLHAHIDRECSGAPSSIGGIGGGAEVVCTAQTPTAVAGIPGIISFIVITGEVPALFPLPLMRTLGGVIHLPRQCVIWTEHEDCESPLIDLWTRKVLYSGWLGKVRGNASFCFLLNTSLKPIAQWMIFDGCLSSSQQQHESPSGSSVAGTLAAEGSADPATVCHHSASGCDLEAQSLSNVDSSQSAARSSKSTYLHRTTMTVPVTRALSYSRSPLTPSKGMLAGVEMKERMCASSPTSQRECACKVVQLRSLPNGAR